MSRFIIFIYFIITCFLWCVIALITPFLAYKTKYKNSLKSRFWLYKNPKFQQSKVHFHACSFGEVRSLTQICESLKDDFCISVITQTGFDEARKISQNVRFLPFEPLLLLWLKKTEILVVTEAELWLMLFYKAKKNGSKTILINARISDKSYKNYMKFAFFYKIIFANIDQIFAQSEEDKQRLEKLGAKNIEICGNLKLNNKLIITKNYKKPQRKLIIIASSHKGEEEQILEQLKEQDAQILVAPRHPERFIEVKNTLKKFAKKHNKTFASFIEFGFTQEDIILLDTLGELINFYAISDIVILCGSFVPKIGGHNPIECANFSNSIISGNYIFNQKELFRNVENVYFAKFDEISQILQKPLLKAKIRQNNATEKILNSIIRE